MMKVVTVHGSLNPEDYDLINALQMQCLHADQISLKLELDYKLGDASNINDHADTRDINEFMYFDENKLVGYVGIISFGGTDASIEITGMVHPEYRRRGIFLKLHSLVISECRRRNPESVLLLCDRKSISGQKFLKTIGAAYKCSEFEMHLPVEPYEIIEDELCGLSFRKATNTDACEIARQNAIYFGDREEKVDSCIINERILWPEDEERQGMRIYLAEMDNKIIGKVHLQVFDGIGAIYGLGVLPECRKKGFGRKILIKAIAMLKAEKAKKIILQVSTGNATALGLYQSCGFQETAVMDYYEWI